MRFRDSLAINISPIMLRLVLGVTFLWAGYGKVFTVATFSPEQIVRIDSMVAGDGGAGEPSLEVIEPDAGQPEEFTPEAPLPEPDEAVTDEAVTDEGDPSAMLGGDSFRVIAVQDGGDGEAAASGERKKVYYLAMMIKDSELLPGFASQGAWPKRLAWLAALTELLGGVFVLLGFLTRLSAIGLGFTMCTALWMTAIGPVVMLGEPSFLGFLPAIEGFAIGAWQGWLWQFALLGSSVSLLLAGPGALSADRFLLGHKASKNAQPGIKPGAKPKAKPKPAFEDDDE